MRHFLGLILTCITFITCAQSTFTPPEKYICNFTDHDIKIDGRPTDEAWSKAEWSSSFVNINDIGIEPPFDTRFKMLWDSTYLYFYAQMEEPHIWANLKKKDTVIFFDNDIELFLDPLGDTHNYYEIEVNAHNTIWDLLLTRAYRDGGRPVNSWDISGGKFAVHIEGTLNDPSDEDDYWAVEAALPWSVLKELNYRGRQPKAGEVWRMNYSRVQWDTDIIDGKYVKVKDPKTGKNKREHNWAWSRQRIIAMHEPELWGQLLFADHTTSVDAFFNNQEEEARQLLYEIHRNQQVFRKNYKRFTDEKPQLLNQNQWSDGSPIEWTIDLSGNRYVVSIKIPGQDHLLHLDETGRNWRD